MSRDAFVARADKTPYQVRTRTCTAADARALDVSWTPVFERGPRSWLDRDWRRGGLDAPTELAFRVNPAWAVMTDEVEPDAQGDLLGVLVTTGPIAVRTAGLDVEVVGEEPVVWVEYIAIAPGLRPDCPPLDQRKILLKGVGPALMLCAIERSIALGCNGRIGLHAEGPVAQAAYLKWKMRPLPEAPHPAGGSFPVFLGDADWAREFRSEREERR